MHISDYTYELPDERIALRPPKIRGDSRLMALNRDTGTIEHSYYRDLHKYLRPEDLVILNDTKVIKARLDATNSNSQKRELLLLERHRELNAHEHKVMYRGKLREGEILTVHSTPVRVAALCGDGIAIVRSKTSLFNLAERYGSVPLPPYMHRNADTSDTERYQTIFAHTAGSVAAPTASLNFTHDLEQKLLEKGVGIAYLTLHVGLGTFMPIRTDNIEEHIMHSEYFEIPESTVLAIQKTLQRGGRIIAIGTTVARTLEFCAQDIKSSATRALNGEANIFIYPGYDFKLIQGLVTNFHAPKSTVLMLTAAFGGWDNVKNAYSEAIASSYSFLSYGDSMFIS